MRIIYSFFFFRPDKLSKYGLFLNIAFFDGNMTRQGPNFTKHEKFIILTFKSDPHPTTPLNEILSSA